MIERALIQRQRALQRGNDFGPAGMTNEAIDITGRKLHPGKHFGDRGTEMLGDEVGNRALKDDAKSLGIDAPSHDRDILIRDDSKQRL